MFQRKEKDKSIETDLNETQKSDLPDREFKIMVIKRLTNVRRVMDKQSENFNKEIENMF